MNLLSGTRASILCVALAACVAPAANATIIYNGGSHTISTVVNDNIWIEANTSLEFVTGGLTNGYQISVRGGSLTVSGAGQLNAGPNGRAINGGSLGSVIVLEDQAVVNGYVAAEVNGGPSGNWQSESTSLARLYLRDQVVVNGDVGYGGFVRISDDARVNGTVRGPGGANVSMDLVGGTITGSLYFAISQHFIITLSGTTVEGGMRGTATGYLDSWQMTGGHLVGGIDIASKIVGQISGGRVDNGINIENNHATQSSNLLVSGGVINAAAGDYLASLSRPGGNTPVGSSTPFTTLEISGGQWGYEEAGTGLFLDGYTKLIINGTGLSFANGLLSGYLADGSWFSNYVTFGANWQGTLTLNETTP